MGPSITLLAALGEVGAAERRGHLALARGNVIGRENTEWGREGQGRSPLLSMSASLLSSDMMPEVATDDGVTDEHAGSELWIGRGREAPSKDIISEASTKENIKKRKQKNSFLLFSVKG